PSRAYVARLFDIIEANPNVGVVIPPTVHIGYGTLGHAWFTNRRAVTRTMRLMGIKLPLDEHTPLAAYGTMYWFRPQALRRMFEHPWKWEDYNAEPHHVDGGMAHVQERLICYAAQADKFRTLSVMNPRAAARNYAKLEYKHQLLASCFKSGDIRRILIEARRAPVEIKPLPPMSRAAFYDWVARTYTSTQSSWPWFWKATQPIKERVWPHMEKVIAKARA
ncbi:MAG: rhamnan synthesis F family protein, partial [Pseudomonadota bacterium]